jgi:toxin HigB-1
MIRSFADKETERVWAEERSRKLPPDIQGPALRKLQLIDAAGSIDDLRIPPGNRLEQLKGDRQGGWSIRVNQQWRICFAWRDGNAEDVEICDYH